MLGMVGTVDGALSSNPGQTSAVSYSIDEHSEAVSYLDAEASLTQVETVLYDLNVLLLPGALGVPVVKYCGDDGAGEGAVT